MEDQIHFIPKCTGTSDGNTEAIIKTISSMQTTNLYNREDLVTPRFGRMLKIEGKSLEK